MNILSALEGYWLSKKRDLSPNTVSDYALSFRRLVEFLSEKQEFEAITTHQVKLFLNHLKSEYDLAPKSMANVWIALSSLWTWAGAELGTEHVLSGKIERPRWHRPPIEPYSQKDVQAMLEAANYARAWRTKTGQTSRAQKRPTALRDRAIIMTLFDTGLRASELCDLCIEDYDRESGRLFVRKGKGNKGRFIYAGKRAQMALWRYLASRAGEAGAKPLFATARGTHLGRDELRHMVQLCAQRAGVEGATVHKFRHSFAITFLRNGGNVLELKALLGHEKLETIQIYAQLAQVDLRAAQARSSPADHWDLR